MTRQYPYQPLAENNIRILVLRAGKIGSPIHASLRQTYVLDSVHNPSSSSPYDALSYEWGPSTSPTETIYIDKIPINIRRNLFLALKHIRLRNQDRALWLDALCIDQNNVPERSAQVRLMGGVYSQAKGVIAWLGPAYGNSSAGFDYVRRAVKAMKNDGTLDNFPQRKDSVKLPSFERLTNRTYWSRLWIIQELVLAKKITIICGADQVDWEDFKTALCPGIFAQGLSTDDAWCFETNVLRSQCVSISNIRDITEDRRTLEHLLEKSVRAKAQDPRDKIYGLLGMLPRSQRRSDRLPTPFPLVNYDKDCFEVFNDTMWYYYSSSSDSDRKLKLIKISQRVQSMLGIRITMEPFPLTRKYPNLREPFHFTAEGIIRTTVRKIGPALHPRSTPLELEKWLAWGESNNMGRYPLFFHDFLNSDRVEEEETAEMYANFARAAEDVFNEEYQGNCAVSIIAHDSKSKIQKPNFETSRSVGVSHPSRRFPRLAKCSHSVAMVPWNTSEGDVICQFADTSISVVISKDPLMLKGTACLSLYSESNEHAPVTGVVWQNLHPGEFTGEPSHVFDRVELKMDIRMLQFLTATQYVKSSLEGSLMLRSTC